MKHGFIKVATVTPKMKTGNIEYNVKHILQNIIEAHTLTAQIAVFPELCLCGKEIGDMAYDPTFLYECECGLKKIVDITRQRDIAVFVGLPVRIDDLIYNAVACLSHGLIIGITIKNHLSKEEKRYYSPLTSKLQQIELAGFVCPVSNDILYVCANLRLKVHIGESPNFLEQSANLLLCISSKAETVESYRGDFLANASREYSLAIAQVGGGIFESTAVNMYTPTKALYECGETLYYSENYNKEILLCDIDIDRVDYIRLKKNSNGQLLAESIPVTLKLKRDYEIIDRKFDRTPFMLKSPQEYEKMLKILAIAIYNRVRHIKAESLVIGVSGGLDSTATLLVVDTFCELFSFDRENVLCLTLPGFASSEKTFNNAVALIKSFNFTHRNVPISDAVKNHLLEIEHDLSEDITYENAQARERTQILMDFANMTSGIMLGTSDMSEEALGFSTFGGDQMSMLNVLSGICKTTIKGLVGYYIDTQSDIECRKVLSSILATPISPELKQRQETEKQIGSYEIHDFTLYNFLANGYSPSKILYIAEKAFEDYSLNEIKETLEIFFSRFFKSQFKRNATSDGVKIFDISLSANNFRLNSDFDGSIFSDEKR